MTESAKVTTADPAAQRTAHLLEIIFPPPRHFGIRLWEGTELRGEAPFPFSLVLNHPGALRRMFKAPVELSLGEAFIRDDFEIEGDIFSAFPLMEGIAARALSLGELVELGIGMQALPGSNPDELQGRGPHEARGTVHSRERDRQVASANVLFVPCFFMTVVSFLFPTQ